VARGANGPARSRRRSPRPVGRRQVPQRPHGATGPRPIAVEDLTGRRRTGTGFPLIRSRISAASSATRLCQAGVSPLGQPAAASPSMAAPSQICPGVQYPHCSASVPSTTRPARVEPRRPGGRSLDGGDLGALRHHPPAAGSCSHRRRRPGRLPAPCSPHGLVAAFLVPVSPRCSAVLRAGWSLWVSAGSRWRGPVDHDGQRRWRCPSSSSTRPSCTARELVSDHVFYVLMSLPCSRTAPIPARIQAHAVSHRRPDSGPARHRLTPADVLALPAGNHRRRTAGLRRRGSAQLAACRHLLHVLWSQGRDVRPSGSGDRPCPRAAG